MYLGLGDFGFGRLYLHNHSGHLFVLGLVDDIRQTAGQNDADQWKHGYADGGASNHSDVGVQEVDDFIVTTLKTAKTFVRVIGLAGKRRHLPPGISFRFLQDHSPASCSTTGESVDSGPASRRSDGFRSNGAGKEHLHSHEKNTFTRFRPGLVLRA